ncbi:cysteine desulfurase-like protein [Agrococcus sp. HG114]|uniref:cysteine desulfurase-like protein n=1 Tax=Agrococcus sp. HG114 TaxID=2969757 RepID=UPI00215B1F00|nr:cysteine desulfurase-like protein [Agrococcus sp. HG114]MCR8669897.1 cysteine desulfurase-like protein [Agrococcus sp. HG114]
MEHTAVADLDVDALRAGFPALASGIAHFDGPGGTQTPAVVGEAIARTLTGPLSNRGRSAVSERNADDAVAAFRSAFVDFLGADPRGIVYGRSATQLTYDFSRALAKRWRPGDELVVTQLDHDANVRPWIQAADRVGMAVRWLRLDPATAQLRLDELDRVVTDRTRLVAVTGASNLLGSKPDVARIAERAHAVGALVHVDAVHLAAHDAIDLGTLGADLLVCSPYKFFGPHCAVLAASPELLETIRPDKLLPSTDAVPERFELGTLPYELMAGATAAVDVIAGLGGERGDRRARIVAANARIEQHELRLRERIEAHLRSLEPRLTLHSVAAERTSTLFVTFAGHDPFAVSAALAERGVLAPAGTFYAHEPFRALGVGASAGLRVGLAPYSSDDDVDRLLEGLSAALA